MRHSSYNMQRLYLVVLAAIVAGALFLLYKIDPAQQGLFPVCPFHAFTGLYCPGCGTLRAVHQILHGNIAAGFRMNPLSTALIPYFFLSFVSYGAEALSGKSPLRIFIPSQVIWGLLFIIISFWILRNIPVYPLTLLVPPI